MINTGQDSFRLNGYKDLPDEEIVEHSDEYRHYSLIEKEHKVR